MNIYSNTIDITRDIHIILLIKIKKKRFFFNKTFFLIGYKSWLLSALLISWASYEKRWAKCKKKKYFFFHQNSPYPPVKGRKSSQNCCFSSSDTCLSSLLVRNEKKIYLFLTLETNLLAFIVTRRQFYSTIT